MQQHVKTQEYNLKQFLSFEQKKQVEESFFKVTALYDKQPNREVRFVLLFVASMLVFVVVLSIGRVGFCCCVAFF